MTERIRFTITVTGEINGKLELLASKKNFSKNTVINEACWRYVEEFESKHGEIKLDKEEIK